MLGVQLLTSTIQFLCVSIFETLLHVTLRGRGEISADIFAGLFAVVPLVLQEFDNDSLYLHVQVLGLISNIWFTCVN